MLGLMMKRVLIALVAMTTLQPLTAIAVPITQITTTVSEDYVIIGMAPGSVGSTVNINNFELGQITGALPGSAPAIPGNAQQLLTGVMSGGNVALTSSTGTFDFQDMQVSATSGIGIQCAASNCATASNSEISFDSGTTYAPLPANGVTTNVDLSALTSEIAVIATDIGALTSIDFDGTVDLSSDGKISFDRYDVFGSGLNVIHIDTGGVDFLLENSSWVIDGVSDTQVLLVFDTPGKNFKVSNGNILAGTGGIGLNNILIAAFDPTSQSTKFDFSNSILNGAAFWDVSGTNNVIGLNNVAGCTQFVGDQISNINDVRLKNCSFGSVSVPEPGTLGLLGAGLLGLFMRRKRVA